MKKVIKKLNRMYKELQPYSQKGIFLLGDPVTPCKFIFYGLPAFYIPNTGEFSFVQDEVSDKQLDVLINSLCSADYTDFMNMTAIISSYSKAIYKFVEFRSAFDTMVESGDWQSKKVYRIAMFRREPNYDEDNFYHEKWQEVIDEKLSQSPDSAEVSVKDTTEKMEQTVSEKATSA